MKRKTSRALLPLLIAPLLLLCASKAFSQAGGGSKGAPKDGPKGGLVLACFDSDPTTFMEPVFNEYLDYVRGVISQNPLDPEIPKLLEDPRYRIYKWPDPKVEDRFDRRYGYASRAIVFDAVNRLRDVQVAEYYAATVDTSWGGSENQIGIGTYHLHPLLFAINDLPVSKKAVPVPQFPKVPGPNSSLLDFPREKLKDPTKMDSTEETAIYNYVNDEEARITDDLNVNTPIFSQIYGMISSMFRGAPAFYTRLQAAHEKLGLIPEHPGKFTGSKSSQWDSAHLSALTGLPKPDRNCLYMTAADRDDDGKMLYDRYLWQHMDLFQRALLQLHEEIYHMGADTSTKLGLNQGDVGPTRYLLARILVGQRTKTLDSGEFSSNCAYYDVDANKRTPPVKLIESGSCLVSNSIERVSIGKADYSFLPSSSVTMDGTTFVNQFICRGGCSPDVLATWDKVARYYGPYSSTGLQALLATYKYFFGRYSTIDFLNDKRDTAARALSQMLEPYDLPKSKDKTSLWNFCDQGGFFATDDAGPPPPENNPRRLESSKRNKLAKNQAKQGYVRKANDPEPRVDATDNDMIKAEEAMFHQILVSRGGNFLLQKLTQDLNLLDDFPDQSLHAVIDALNRLKIPDRFSEVTDLNPGKGGRNIPALKHVCSDVRKRQQDLLDLQFILGTEGEPHLTFYERPDSGSALDRKIPRFPGDY